VPVEAQIPVIKPGTEIVVEDVVMPEMDTMPLERTSFSVRGESSFRRVVHLNHL
jgi:hypothetical protein